MAKKEVKNKVKYNQEDILRELAERENITQIDSRRVMFSLLDIIIEHLKKGETIHINQFGTFKADKREAHTCRNPRTKELMTVDEFYAPKFIPSSAFKTAIKEAYDKP